jgi:small-conductance mechanosensitive channel
LSPRGDPLPRGFDHARRAQWEGPGADMRDRVQRSVVGAKPILRLTLIGLSTIVVLFAYAASSAPVAWMQGPEPEPTPTRLLDAIIGTRTPEPTATPDRIEEAVVDLALRAGLGWPQFLGLSVVDWINLGISALIGLAGFLLGTLLIAVILPRVARRMQDQAVQAILEATGPGLRWLIVCLSLYYATLRLTFVQAAIKAVLGTAYFGLAVVITFYIIWKLIDLGEVWYREQAAEEGREEQLSPLIVLLGRLVRIVFVITGVSILLSELGINVTAFAAVLGVVGLAVSLAARDTIADAIAGFLILADRPFRIGDRIEIQSVDTWGDVVEIGLRTTRIRTRDNRMVIMPNGTIGKNQVINYTYPDPRYRIQTHVGVAYGTDIETARRVITEAVRTVDDVLPDRPVDVLYHEMGDWAMVFRVRWWIKSYADALRMTDQVHIALQEALDAAGIDCPYPTSRVRVNVDELSSL